MRWSSRGPVRRAPPAAGSGPQARTPTPSRWRTFGFTALVNLLAALTAIVFGIGLLLTERSLNFINLASSLVFMLTVPFAAIALTLYYFDLEARGSAPTAGASNAPG